MFIIRRRGLGCRRRVAECCAHSISHLLSPPLQSSLAPAVGETADFASIFPHAIPEYAGRLLAIHVGEKRATGDEMLTLRMQLSVPKRFRPAPCQMADNTAH